MAKQDFDIKYDRVVAPDFLEHFSPRGVAASLAHMAGTAHPALYALVDVASGDPHGITMIDEMVRAQPVPPTVRASAMMLDCAGSRSSRPAVP